jgi:hypothetical protein
MKISDETGVLYDATRKTIGGVPILGANAEDFQHCRVLRKEHESKLALEYENMNKEYRDKGKPGTPRYKQLKEKLMELGKRNGEITSRNFAKHIGVFSESSARDWLVIFEEDGIIKLVERRFVGGKVYVLNDSAQHCEPQTHEIKKVLIFLLNKSTEGKNFEA